MSFDPAKLARQLRRLYPGRRIQLALSAPPTLGGDSYVKYKYDPVAFAREVLKWEPTPDQDAIMRRFPGRVKVNAGHSVGKTAMAAVLVIWWFCTRDPCVIITTAPTKKAVVDLLWTEIRLIATKAGLTLPFIGPRAPEMFHHDEHWAVGLTSSTGEAFQGRHRPSMLFLFDECEDVDPIYWQVTDTMYQPGSDHAWLAIGNPVTTSSQSYVEDTSLAPGGVPKWQLFQLSSLSHPNIIAELQGLPPPIPNAVTLGQVEQWLGDWAEPISFAEKRPADIEWPPQSARWYRPGPLFKARVLGIRPTEGVDTVWGQDAWDRAITPHVTPQECWLSRWGITIGVDVAVYGDDNSVIHIRTGPLSLHHESHNGWGSKQLADRIKVCCVEWASWYNAQACQDRSPLLPGQVKVKIELDGPGHAVLERNTENGKIFGSWFGISVAEASDKLDSLGRPKYANKRAEMWLEGADRAKKGAMDLSRLDKATLERLHRQLLTPAFLLQGNGSILVEAKKDVKRRLRRSPDDADGLLVCYTDATVWMPSVVTKPDDED